MATPIIVRTLRCFTSLVLVLQFLFATQTIAYTCDYPSDYNYLKTACPTLKAFCSSLVANRLPKPYTETLTEYSISYKTTTTVTASEPTQVYIATPSYYKTVVFTTTIGKTTTTLDHCGGHMTCGAATITVPDCARLSCSSLFRKETSTEVFYTTYTEHVGTETLYPKTKTITTSTPAVRYPIKTVTVETATEKSCVTAPLPERTCGNIGYQYARWRLTHADFKDNLTPWDLDHYKTIPPIKNGTGRGEIGRVVASYYDVYYEYKNECRRTYRSWRGYLYAPQTGKYIFRVPTVTTLADIWIGDVAYSAYNSSNSFLSTGGRGEKEIHFTRGQYYPFRIATACTTTKGYAFFLNIEQPDGLVLEGTYDPNHEGYYPDYFPLYYHYDRPYGQDTSYFVQFGCGADASAAPKFPDWGHET